jgi:hypothetical protein
MILHWGFLMTQQKPTTKPPPPPTEEEVDQAKRELVEASERFDEKAKKHGAAADDLKRTISNPKLQAVRLPTPSQLELEAKPPPK